MRRLNLKLIPEISEVLEEYLYIMPQPFVGGTDTPYGTGWTPTEDASYTIDMNITLPSTINTETEACGCWDGGVAWELSLGNSTANYYFRTGNEFNNLEPLVASSTHTMRVTYYGGRVVFMLDDTVLEDNATSGFLGSVEFWIGARNRGATRDRPLTTWVINSFVVRKGAYQTPVGLLGKTGEVKIMPLGDSITYGAATGQTSALECFGYRGFLWSQLRTMGYTTDFVGSLSAGSNYLTTDSSFDMDNEGHMGWDADQILAQLPTYLTTENPDIVLLHIGTNDITGSQAPAGIVTEVEGILDAIKAHDVTIQTVVARIIQRDPYHTPTYDYNELLVAMVQARIDAGDASLHLVDMAAALTYPDDIVDGKHPTEVGYRKMATAWCDKLTGG